MKTEYNQLKLGNKTTKLFEYKNLEYFYRMVLNAWRSEYPEGKIDYMRFLMDWSRLSGNEINRIMQDIYNMLDMGPSVMDSTLVVVDWSNPVECRMKLAHLMSALCYCVNLHDCFDANAFNKAFDKYFSNDFHADSN